MRRRVAKKVLRRWLQDPDCPHRNKTLQRAYDTLKPNLSYTLVMYDWWGHAVIELPSMPNWEETVQKIEDNRLKRLWEEGAQKLEKKELY